MEITMSTTRIAPLAKTIAFGGVALRKTNSMHFLIYFYFTTYQ
jgi:hypothetical protein